MLFDSVVFLGVVLFLCVGVEWVYMGFVKVKKSKKPLLGEMDEEKGTWGREKSSSE